MGDCQMDDPLYAQITADLAAWEVTGFTNITAPDYTKLCPANLPRPQSCYYITILVKDGTVYLTSQIERVIKETGRAHMLTGFLLELYEASLNVHLPDAEFAWYGGDTCPDLRRATHKHPVPGLIGRPSPSLNQLPAILTFSKSAEEPCALIPFSGHQRCGPDNIDHLLSDALALPDVTWTDRKPVAFGHWTLFCAWWQSTAKWPTGESTGCGRAVLPAVGRLHPDLLDVGTTREGSRPFADHTMFKYAVSTDGWSASSRLEKAMLTGAAVLKQTSPKIGYFYHLLREYEHFVPIWKDNASDILQAVKWARAHDKEAHNIAVTAAAFFRKNMRRPSRVCYWRRLMSEIGRLTRVGGFVPAPCSERAVCVPALQELSFMGHYVHCSSLSTVHQQLDAMHVQPLDHGVKVGSTWDTAPARISRNPLAKK